MSKPRVLLFLLVVTSLLLSACQTQAPATTAPPVATTGSQTAPTEGLPADMADSQVLRFVYERGNLLAPAPHRVGDIGREWSQLLYMTLVVADKDNNLLPGIAESWEANEDNTSYTFHLNPAAVWSTGGPVTAADVKAAWEWNADPRTLNTQINNVLGTVVGFSDIVSGTDVSLAGLVAVDDQTLRVDLARSDPVFLNRVTLHWSGIAKVDEIIAAGTEANTYLATTPTVNGPYTIGKWDPATNEYDLVLNPAWWGTKPLIERIELRSILDPQTIVVVMENQEADAGYVLGSDTVAEMKRQLGEESAIVKPVMFVIYWYWFVNRDLTDDVNLRAALLHAIDMNQIAQVSTQGTFAAWTNLFHPLLPCWDPATGEEYYTYDPELAKEELAQSKYGPTGADVPHLVLSALGVSEVQRAAQIIVEMWRQNLGIEDVEIVTQALPPNEATRMTIGRLSMTAYVPDPINILTNLGYSKGFLAGVMGGYENPELDAAIEAADATPRDDPQFCDMAREAHDIFAQDYMIIPYIAQDRFWFVQPWIKNVGINNSESPYSLFTEPLMYIAEH